MRVEEQTNMNSRPDFLSNRCLRRLRAGEISVGTVALANSATAAGILAGSDLDHLVIDLQHGEWDELGRIEAIRAIALQGTTPMVRVVANGFANIGRALDIGALGVVVPMLNTAEEARVAARAMRYPPVGGRSAAYPLSVHYPSNYWDRANDEVMLMLQIETAEGIENVEAIVAVEGVDAILIGPTDISLTTGNPIGSPQHDAAMRRILRACQTAGVIPGTFAGTPEMAQRWLAEGFRMVTVGTDLGLLGASVSDMARKARTPA